MLVNSNFGIITLTCNLRYELFDKNFSISVSDLINFLILYSRNQVVFTGNLLKPKNASTIEKIRQCWCFEILITVFTSAWFSAFRNCAMINRF